MRLLGIWTAVLMLASIVTAEGCGGANMNPAGAGKMDDKNMSDGNMMSDGKMATDGNMMNGKMSGDDKMKSEKMSSDDTKMSGEKK
jgi:hypothetical protein